MHSWCVLCYVREAIRNLMQKVLNFGDDFHEIISRFDKILGSRYNFKFFILYIVVYSDQRSFQINVIIYC